MSFTRTAGLPPSWLTVTPIVSGISTSYAALLTDYYIGVNGTGVTITLPLGTNVSAGKSYVIKDESGLITLNSAYRFNIQTSGSDKIDGSSTLTVTTGYTAITVIWAGTFWSII